MSTLNYQALQTTSEAQALWSEYQNNSHIITVDQFGNQSQFLIEHLTQFMNETEDPTIPGQWQVAFGYYRAFLGDMILATQTEVAYAHTSSADSTARTAMLDLIEDELSQATQDQGISLEAWPPGQQIAITTYLDRICLQSQNNILQVEQAPGLPPELIQSQISTIAENWNITLNAFQAQGMTYNCTLPLG